MSDTAAGQRRRIACRRLLICSGLRGSLVAKLPAHRPRHRKTVRRIHILVLQRRVRQAARRQAVLALIDGGPAAADHAADQVRVAVHDELKPTVPGLDAALLDDAEIVAVDGGLADTARCTAGAVAERRDADAGAEASAVLLAVVDGLVLQAVDVQVAADVRNDAVRADDAALDVGVATALQGDRAAGADVAVAVAEGVAIGLAIGAVGRQLQRQAVLGAAHVVCDPDAGAAAAVGAVLAAGVLRGQQVDLVVGDQRHVAAAADVAADRCDVAARAATGRNDRHVAARLHLRAHRRAAALHDRAFAFAVAQADADLDAHWLAGRRHARIRVGSLHAGGDGRQRRHAVAAGIFRGRRQRCDAPALR